VKGLEQDERNDQTSNQYSESAMTDAVLKYNVRWIEHTFTSRLVTESLLSPERESGNITTNDYEAATAFFPGPTRRYGVCLFFFPFVF
jgi:hypothetical protein